MSQAQTVASPGFDKAPCSRSNSTGKEALKAYYTPLLAEELLCGSILSDYYQFFFLLFFLNPPSILLKTLGLSVQVHFFPEVQFV